MYKLYYYPLNASMAPHFILEELDQPFELVLVDRKSNAQKSQEYLALNPAGRIPTLVHDEQVIFESPAICMYLGESNPDAKLVPAISSSERAKFLQWMMYLTNTLQSELMVYFYPQKHTDKPSGANAISHAQEKRVTDILVLLDNELSNKDYLIGSTVSVCDFYLFMLCIWADELPKPPLAFKNLGAYLKRMAKRQSIVKVCEKENLCLNDYQ